MSRRRPTRQWKAQEEEKNGSDFGCNTVHSQTLDRSSRMQQCGNPGLSKNQ